MARTADWLMFLSVVAMFTCTSGVWVSEPDGVSVSNCPTDVTINQAGKGAYVTWPTPTAATHLNFPPFEFESAVVSYPNGTQMRAVNGAWYPTFPESDGPYTVTYAWCNGQCAICQFNFEVEAGNNPNPCQPSPCMHGGACMVSTTGQEYHCYCTEQYTGRRCESEILPPGYSDPRTPCSSSPCQHGGDCTQFGFLVPFYICNCFNGYTGNDCQIPPPDANPCLSNPCINGQCVTQSTNMEGVFTYTCDCSYGFMGSQCDMIAEPCLSSPCLNNGGCVEDGTVFVCECTDQYRGILCEMFVGVLPVLTCPLQKSVLFSPNQTSPGTYGAKVMYTPAEITGGSETYDLTYSHPSGSFFPYGFTIVRVTAATASGIYTPSCEFDVYVGVEDGSIPLSSEQTQKVTKNYENLLNIVPRTSDGQLDTAAFSEPFYYGMDVVGELSDEQEEMILEQYPDLFVDEFVARNTLKEENRRRRRNVGFDRICPIQFEATTNLVVIADTDGSGHAGLESQLVQVNNRIQWAFNAECGNSFCNRVQTFDGSPCQCIKSSRVVSALVFNLRASQQMGFQFMPVQFKQVYIHNCDGAV